MLGLVAFGGIIEDHWERAGGGFWGAGNSFDLNLHGNLGVLNS